MAYTEADLEQLIKSVETEFTAHLSTLNKSETEVLAKGEFPPKKEEKKPESKEEPKKEESKEEPKEGHEEHKPEAKEGEKATEGQEPGEAKPDAEQQAQGSDHCDYDEQDMDHMHKMYMSMSKGELKAHHDSCRAALEGQGMQKCGDMSMAKSETIASVEVNADLIAGKDKELELAKSEVAAANARTEALQKNFDAATAFLTKLVEKRIAPQGKAITSLDVIAKSEGGKEEKVLDKGEILALLSKKSQDPKLEKSDREAINAYYLNSGSINSISHLLK
jgi:hypothetical protein